MFGVTVTIKEKFSSGKTKRPHSTRNKADAFTHTGRLTSIIGELMQRPQTRIPACSCFSKCSRERGEMRNHNSWPEVTEGQLFSRCETYLRKCDLELLANTHHGTLQNVPWMWVRPGLKRRNHMGARASWAPEKGERREGGRRRGGRGRKVPLTSLLTISLSLQRAQLPPARAGKIFLQRSQI